jgi:hypothetical protein
MHVRRISTSAFLSFLIIMFITVTGCGKMQATSVVSGTVSGDVVTDGVAANVTIKMTGSETKSITTDASGNFSFNNQNNGAFTITPYYDGYSFTPTSTDVVVSGTSVTGTDFTSSWAGYSISGAVTGAVQKGVTLTLNTSGSTTSLTSTTADSDGKYTLTNTAIIKNSSFDVNPSLAGYKFNPSKQSVSGITASVTGIDFVSVATHKAGTAQGTYTWDSTKGALVINWTSSDFPCNWPKPGVESKIGSHVTITKTTMTWNGAIQWPGVTIWTRTSSTADDPAGEWTTTDQSGNTYTATITAANTTSGEISLTGEMIVCAYAWSSDDYKVRLSYQDPGHAATTVAVTGNGISGSLSLDYSAGEWSTTDPIALGSSHEPPYTYVFTINDSETKWDEASCFVEWATSLYTEWTAKTNTLTFYWTAISDSGALYVVQLKDSSYNLIWESFPNTATSVDYLDGPALTAGNTYYYYVQVRGSGNCSNGKSISVEGSFSCSGDPLSCAD